VLVDIDSLRQHRAAIRLDVGTPFVWGSFEQLQVSIQIARAFGRRDLDRIYA